MVGVCSCPVLASKRETSGPVHCARIDLHRVLGGVSITIRSAPPVRLPGRPPDPTSRRLGEGGLLQCFSITAATSQQVLHEEAPQATPQAKLRTKLRAKEGSEASGGDPVGCVPMCVEVKDVLFGF